MKIGSDCTGKCCVCRCGSGCIAGHGDDFFFEATKEQIISRLDKGHYPDYRDYMISYLKKKFGVEYTKQSQDMYDIPQDKVKNQAFRYLSNVLEVECFNMLNIDGVCSLHFPTVTITQKNNSREEKHYTFVFTQKLSELCYYATTELLHYFQLAVSSFGIAEIDKVKAAIKKANKLISFFEFLLPIKQKTFVSLDKIDAYFIKASLEHCQSDDYGVYFDFVKQMKQYNLGD